MPGTSKGDLVSLILDLKEETETSFLRISIAINLTVILFVTFCAAKASFFVICCRLTIADNAFPISYGKISGAAKSYNWVVFCQGLVITGLGGDKFQAITPVGYNKYDDCPVEECSCMCPIFIKLTNSQSSIILPSRNACYYL